MELHAVEGTITLDVIIEPAYPRAGEVVRFRVEATDTDGGVVVIGFDPGDRREASRPGAPSVDCVARDPGAPPRERPPASRTGDFTHAYRVAANRRLSVTVASGDCGRRPNYAELSGTITVLPGATTSNGPQEPRGGIFQNSESAAPGSVRMSISASDVDGVVRRVTVDWGDGSTPSVVDVARDERDCANEPTAYPRSGNSHSLDHIYARPGSYTVTASIASTGCDGRNEQAATASGIATLEAEPG